MLLEEASEILSLGWSVVEGLFTSICIEKATRRIEHTEFERENFHDIVLWVWDFLTAGSNCLDHRFASPHLIRMAPAPKPGSTWIPDTALGLSIASMK